MIQEVRVRAKLVKEHLRAMRIGSEVTRWFRQEREPHVLKVTPQRVLAALHEAGINCVLLGTHGLNGYRDEARATQDVDVLVTKRDTRKAIRILEETFPYLEVKENASVARFVDPVTQKVVIDLMKPSSRVFRTVFHYTVAIGDTHRIPDLEMALATKFVAMISPTRRLDKKQIDAGDFTNIAMSNRDGIDLQKLKRLGDKVHPGGGNKILAMMADIDASRPIRL